MARAPVAALIGTVQVDFAPLHPPLHERNFHPFAGFAASFTGVNEANEAEQRGRQLMPALELRTVPLPPIETVNRKVAGAKSAETCAPAVTVTLQARLPLQDPPQRTSLIPVPGVAVRFSACPEFHVVEQFAEHWRPGTSAVTVPVPETVSASGAWLSSRTSQAESCVSGQAPECP